MVKGYYQSLESFGLVDGPGVRSILFLTGCPFRCLFCHNPDTWILEKGMEITPEEAFKKLYRYHTYWQNNGGITLSGGEPLVQLDFLIEFAKICKKNNVNLTIDTSGANFTLEKEWLAKFDELLENINLIMLDIKCIDNEIHKKLTGKGNENVIHMFQYLNDKNFPIWIRHVLVPTITDDDVLLEKTYQFIKTLKNVKRVEVLPYHTLGIHKYQLLNMPYRLDGVNPPSKERIENANKILHTEDFKGYLEK